MMLTAGCNGDDCGCAERDIRLAVERQMKSYPHSTLRDIYKNFFQDHFGPGHIISDTASASAYLSKELASREKFAGSYYEPTGYSGNFYRVNLSVVKEGIVPYGIYLDAFLRSANVVKPTPIDEWKKEWQAVGTVVDEMDLQLQSYDEDKTEIDNLLQSGQYAMHHSRTYTKEYDPHYRIIAKDIFENEILPIINRNI